MSAVRSRMFGMRYKARAMHGLFCEIILHLRNQFNKHMKKLLFAVLTVFTLQSYAQCWKQIEFGSGHAIALKDDGTLWTWGHNASGQLGDGTTVAKTTPIQIGTATDWETVSTEQSMNLALKTDGTLWAWGDNFYGQIAGGNNPQTTPLQIGTAGDWKTISCGNHHMLAIKNDGTLWVWGYNGYGAALGLGNYVSVALPTQLGTDTDWYAISTGHYSSYAIKSNGTLWAWGWNNVGQIGNGAMEGITPGGPDVKVPTQIGTDTDWKAIDAGGQHVIAQKTDNKLWSWGSCAFGELGDNSVMGRSTPQQMSTDTWLSFTSGNGTSSGVKTNGKLYRWGFENNAPSYVPTEISADSDWVLSLTTSQGYLCAVKSNGEIYMKGNNNVGQLGLGDTNYHLTPAFFGNRCMETTGLNDNTLTAISLYPNPTSSTLTLANAENLNIENLTVTDMTGKVVLSQNNNNTQINVEKLPVGIYFLEVSAKEGVQNLKFIKE